MKLLSDPGYAIRALTPPTPDSTPTSEIIVTGVPTGKIIEGAVFEAALRWNEYVLLFLTDDVPFEDTLNIYLLDTDLNIVDSAHMFFMYSTGIFSDLDLTQPDTVRFCFFGGIVWTLQLFPKKTFTLPMISDPTGVNRPFTFFRMFQIYGRPLPETPSTTDMQTQGAPLSCLGHDALPCANKNATMRPRSTNRPD